MVMFGKLKITIKVEGLSVLYLKKDNAISC